MKAMILDRVTNLAENSNPLRSASRPAPKIDNDELLIRVSACGVCHTELDEIEGRTAPPYFPIILGHQVIGRIVEIGKNVTGFRIDDRVGVGWIFSSCGKCQFCLAGNENLCPDFKATGRDVDGGYAEYMAMPHAFAHRIPETFTDTQAAPLLCAGAIGYRSLRLAGIKDGQNLGLTGFGASAHLVITTAKFLFSDVKIFVFARGEAERQFAIELGADWAGDTNENSPEKLDAIIDTTPVWKPVVEALKNLKAAGRLVINAIRKEDVDKGYLLKIDYPAHLWLEKEIKSVANVARIDISEFLRIAAEIPIKPEVQEFALEDANRALLELKLRKIRGAKVLTVK